MGYSLAIGEAVVDYDQEYGLEASCRIDVKPEHDKNAPAFGEPTDYTNSRWPSYTAWWNFCQFVELVDAMYYQDGNIRGGHPGCFPITKEFKLEVDHALEKLKMKYPNAVANYDEDENGNIPEENGALCRLLWLKYWVDWSLENCEKPVFVNS